MILRSRTIEPENFAAETGWQLKEEGACKGDVCIPLTEEVRTSRDAIAIAQAMRLPVVEDQAHGLISIGPESIGARALTTAQAADVVLPDLEGNPFALSSLKGQKIVVYAWAPY